MQVASRAIHINPSIVSADLDNETVLLNVETGLYFGLDELGSLIWSMLAEGESRETISERLLAIYDVEPVRLLHDVDAFLDLLEANGLAYVNDPGTH
ncbi:MAG TPA: PqqD family protein [Thermomicrobiales bacterium]|nr:PqqD family protein [Thermomicrobiales bacterium]